jgi:hypothetical protein
MTNLKHFVMAHRTAGSVCGAAERPLKSEGVIIRFDTEELARAEAARYNASTRSPNVYYTYGGLIEDVTPGEA